MSDERRGEDYNRQIDRIEKKIDRLCGWMDGQGEVLGAKDKINIMWGYRLWFIGIVAANAVTAILYFTKFFSD